LVLVTHDHDLAKYADKVFHVLDGNILSVEHNKNPQFADPQLAKVQ